MLNEDEFEWIKEFVGTRGGGLIFMDGRREVYREYTWGALASLFPVERLANPIKEPPSMLVLTDLGSSFGPLRLTADAADNASSMEQDYQNEKPLVSYVAGVDVNYRMTNRWNVQGGVYLS